MRQFTSLITLLFLSSCTTQNAPLLSSKLKATDTKQALENSGYEWRNDKHCYAKSTNWGTYCLKISDERTVKRDENTYRYIYLEGIPLIVADKISQDSPIPRAFSFDVLVQQKDGSWHSLASKSELYTTTAPARIANVQFTNLGKNNGGYIQRLFFADGQNIFREKALITYLANNVVQYTLTDTGINDAYRKQLNGTNCDKKSKYYNEEKCRNKVTIVGSAIGYHEMGESSRHTNEEYYPLTVDCKGTRLGHSVDCSYQLIFDNKSNSYHANHIVKWLVNNNIY